MENIFFASFLLLVLSPILLGVFALCYSIYQSVAAPVVQNIRLSARFTDYQRAILEKHVPYYSRMKSAALKRQFEKRVLYFLLDKEFISRHMPGVTQEMKLMVGAAAAQVTFGFTPLRFPDFPTILIYPTEYLNKVTGRKHRGEVNTKGVIVFSWTDYMKGFDNPQDGINLGLHEMAHALKIEDFTPNEEEGVMDETAYRQWNRIALQQLERMRAGYDVFLRKYAATNIDEFWAVCIEQFFEQSEEFLERNPELYRATARILNQDPLQPDYRYIRVERSAT